MVTFPAAISRRATTVGLSFSQATVGSAPLASRRARCAASSTSWKRLSTFVRQSSTVIRAIAQDLRKEARQAGAKGRPSYYFFRPSANLSRGRGDPVHLAALRAGQKPLHVTRY